MKKVLFFIIFIASITSANAQTTPPELKFNIFDGLSGYRQIQHRARINATVYLFAEPTGGQITAYFKQMSDNGTAYQVIGIPIRLTEGQARTIKAVRPLVAVDGTKYFAIKVLITCRFASPDFVPEQEQDLLKYRDNWLTEYWVDVAETPESAGQSSYKGSL